MSISFGEMAACAATASAAIELLATGIRTDGVLRGLAEGETLCKLLDRGTRARANRESFSAAGLEAGEFVGLVISTKIGRALAPKADDVMDQMRQLRDGRAHGSIQLEELRDYFYSLARVLTAQGALRKRLARDLALSW